MPAHVLPTFVTADTTGTLDLRPHAPLQRVVIMTSAGWLERGVLERVDITLHDEPFVAPPVASHPTVSGIIELNNAIPALDAIIAIGGGSVIDAAKAILLIRSLPNGVEGFRSHIACGDPVKLDQINAFLIAIPTTAGTGSEVSKWATVWGDGGSKYSISHRDLQPRVVALLPELCESMPKEIALACGLDALSHAMEAVWNRNATILSDFWASVAINSIRKNLPLIARDNSTDAKRDMQLASLHAGLAMSSTQTALAHSISYELTKTFGVAHGFAAGLTLGEVARFNLEYDESRLQIIADAFACTAKQLPDAINDFLQQIGIGEHLATSLTALSVRGTGTRLIHASRSANNLRPVSATDAEDILRSALSSILS